GGSLFLGAAPPPEPAFRFEDATLETGLQFTYRASGAEALQLPAIMGGGAAFLDFDRDGDLDLFLAQGGQLSKQGPSGGPEGARLYRNDLGRGPDGRPQTHFVDVTAATGAGVKLYGLGVATGDYDGDGFVDRFVAGFGGSRLLRNVAGKRFEDATVRAGVGGSGFAVAATFFDFDRDGDLDLFVARYVHYPLDPPVACFAPSSRPDYCGPQSFAGEADLFYVNRGDGTFEEASARLTPEKPPLPGLGVVAADFDRDGWPDLLVANDGQPNQLWHNLRGRRFEEVGLEAGVALNGLGLPEANMGIAVGDADGDLAEDVLITHLTGETNTFFHQTGPGQFEDRSTLSGL
ncbi:MAG TPA: VCBS repeat-containing protein, partial [Thermoanaerobaculia bacterium]|nr:VCBS repeat-containing protein [Thermoanaerobaculia bacterium]